MAFTRIRRDKSDAFTSVCNVVLRDRNLSLKAKGLFAIIMALPDEWQFTVSGLASILKESRTRIYTIIQELERFGYCERRRARNELGQVKEAVYTFRENPINTAVKPNPEKPNQGLPDMDLPNQEKRTQIKTYKNKRLIEYPPTEVQDVQTPKQRVWSTGVELLKQSGLSADSSRSFLGKLIKDFGDAAVAEAVANAAVKNAADPKAYLIKMLKPTNVVPFEIDVDKAERDYVASLG